MKKSVFQILFNLATIGTLTSSCTIYEHYEVLEEGLSNEETKALLDDLAEGNTANVKLKGGHFVKGKVIQISDSSLILWKDKVTRHNIKSNDVVDYKTELLARGLKVNYDIVLKQNNGETIRGKLKKIEADRLLLSVYVASNKGFVDHGVNFSKVSELRFKEFIGEEICFQDISKINYDINKPQSIIGTTVIAVGVAAVIAIALNKYWESLWSCPEGEDCI